MRHRDTFDGWPDEQVIAFMTENQYTNIRKLPDGEWCGLFRLAFTWSVCMGVTPLTSFRYRWCFADREEALYLIETAEEYDGVPVRKTSLKGHRYPYGQALYKEKDEHGFEKW
ncbi:hypothetical protein [Escherichia coli]|uniref:hypothetical protein n=1 Tax=Escherichia coli TaxID=562 RepID=UPI002340F78E|nr:hypothetical protein [Escherichia coli]MDC3552198.1 hypothetical protein [Escherichia coli]